MDNVILEVNITENETGVIQTTVKSVGCDRLKVIGLLYDIINSYTAETRKEIKIFCAYTGHCQHRGENGLFCLTKLRCNHKEKHYDY